MWLFRERLKNCKLMETLFNRFHEQLANQGYVAKGGQMMDATFVEAPCQRNTRAENKAIKAGQVPQAWETKPHKLAQKNDNSLKRI